MLHSLCTGIFSTNSTSLELDTGQQNSRELDIVHLWLRRDSTPIPLLTPILGSITFSATMIHWFIIQPTSILALCVLWKLWEWGHYVTLQTLFYKAGLFLLTIVIVEQSLGSGFMCCHLKMWNLNSESVFSNSIEKRGFNWDFCI